MLGNDIDANGWEEGTIIFNLAGDPSSFLQSFAQGF